MSVEFVLSCNVIIPKNGPWKFLDSYQQSQFSDILKLKEIRKTTITSLFSGHYFKYILCSIILELK